MRASHSRTTMTPNTKDRYNYVPQTLEKEKAPLEDRQIVHEKSQIVIDKLIQLNVAEFNDIIIKGLKSMTIKQFIIILRYLLKPICGNVALDGTNYIDYIFTFIQKVDYPYQNLTKSTLKTPTAPHCINVVIFFLAWLAEFSLPPERTSECHNFIANSMFPSVDFIKDFMSKTGQAFQLWNNQEDGADAITQEITDNYIELHTEGSTDVEGEVLRLKGLIEGLKREIRPESLHGTYIAKRDESIRLNQKIEATVESINNLTTKIKQEKHSLDQQKQMIANLNKEVAEIRETITKQGMTMSERVQVLKNLSQARVMLAGEKEQAQNLMEEANEKEIHYANLLQKKSKLIGEINNFIYKFASDLVSIDSKGEIFDPSKVEIRDKDNVSEFKNDLVKLVKALNSAKNFFDRNLKDLQQVKHGLIDRKRHLGAEYDLKLAECEKHKEIFLKMDAKIVKIEKKTAEIITNGMQKIHENSMKIHKFSSDIAQTRDFIEQCRETNDQIREKIEEFKENSLAMVKQLYEQKKSEYEEHQKKLNEKKKFIEEFNKIRQPLPDSVRKTLENLDLPINPKDL